MPPTAGSNLLRWRNAMDVVAYACAHGGGGIASCVIPPAPNRS